ncbi:MAG TPA: hypothetical protein VJY39_04120, partial [Acidisphaera sp.]|nr:hypothetical protein [Acidisphaera sp.]
LHADPAGVPGMSGRSSTLKNRHRRRRQNGSGGSAAEKPRKQEGVAIACGRTGGDLAAQLETMRTLVTDLRLREAMARSRATALQAEVERLNALLEAGLLHRLRKFWRRRALSGHPTTARADS